MTSSRPLGRDPDDVAIGARIRERRRARRLSQTGLAEAIGVTFQQVQKYESGANRISASTLVRIARALKVSAADLFGEGVAGPGQLADILAALDEPGARDLLGQYLAIRSAEVRRKLVSLVQQVANDL